LLYIVYGVDKITLLLVMATSLLRRYQNLSQLFNTAQKP